jgi:hypothetical protein
MSLLCYDSFIHFYKCLLHVLVVSYIPRNLHSCLPMVPSRCPPTYLCITLPN